MLRRMIELRLLSPPLDEAFIVALHALAERVFGACDEAELRWKLTRMPDLTVHAAFEREALVGFKVGYATAPQRYYTTAGSAEWIRACAARAWRGGS